MRCPTVADDVCGCGCVPGCHFHRDHLPLAVVRPVAAVGVSPAQVAAKRGKSVYQHCYEDAKLSVGIFILGPGTSIPLHDHPGMTVVSRMYVRGYALA